MTEVMSKISIEKISQSKITEVDFNNIVFGKQFSDHMFVADYKDGKWSDFKILPFGKIEVSPACAALHYGQAVFEGMKAYKNEQNEVLLFRPLDNAKRLNISAKRLCMPEIPEDIFMEGLTQLIKLDSEWVPKTEGSSLYIRPYMFASEQLLGVRPADEYKFIIFTAPVNSYYAEPVNVKIETSYSRATEGGVGYAKAAGNYAAALYPAKLGQDAGYQQLIWTDSVNHEYIEESGTMNVMFHIGDKLITPNLDFKTTLAGITRNSVLTLAKDLGITVEERRVSVTEVINAAKEGVLKDVFGTGTAATIAQVASITFKDDKYVLPKIEERELSNKLAKMLQEIKHEKIEDKYSWIHKI
ncbi:branched-chain amino acid aminotransferase [Vicingus serpentipes]|uniref:branched-chain-amino-acid transaminase n=2 Tax=Vicingus serpentipes TaxID=1926625 RepID=A0A5C6RV50_9FLAO|nr:branched-chain amino acid aminotransferase [Vicingus serpentipes]